MKVISKFAIVLAVGALVAAGSSNVFATCALPGSSFTSQYFDAPAGFQDVSQAQGKFWGLGQFNPASPGGTDNGLIGPGDGAEPWLRYFGGAGFYVFGDWAGNLYDGCPQDAPNPQPARMALQWTTSDGSDSYFVAICATEDAFGAFPVADIPSAPMVRVPKPVIHASSRAGTTTNLTVGTEPLSGGVYNTGGCPLAVTGFKIYTQTVPRNAAAPSGPNSRTTNGWTLLGSSAGADVAGAVNCATDGDVYLLTTLVLDGNVEIGQGSRNSTKVECGPNLATPSGEGNEFRFIRKPKTAKGR